MDFFIFILGYYNADSTLTAMEFDSPSGFIFVGDSSGNILLLRINGSDAQLISKLSAHTGLFPLLNPFYVSSNVKERMKTENTLPTGILPILHKPANC